MKLSQSRLTAQGQISVPAEIRRRLGLGPGSVLEWGVEGDQVIIRRAGRYTSEEVRRALFPFEPEAPKARTLDELKEGIRQQVRARHARG